MRRPAIATILCALLVPFLTTLGAAPAANATAGGCEPFRYQSVITGTLCHGIVGSGLRITDEDASVKSIGNICNWRIDFRYRDMAGNWYIIDTGATHYSCSRTPYEHDPLNWYARNGIACAYLYANGAYVVRQCHSISG